MTDKFIATKMKRYQLEQDISIYHSERIIVGYIEADHQTLIDENGIYYKNFMTNHCNVDGIENIYGNPIKINHLELVLDETLSEQEKIEEYFKQTRKVIYLSMKHKDNTIEYFPINIEEFKHRNEMKSFIKSEEYISPAIINYSNTDAFSDFTFEEIEESYKTGEMRPDIAIIIQKAVSGELELEKLKDMRERFTKDISDIEDAIDSLDLQIETIDDEFDLFEKEFDYLEKMNDQKSIEKENFQSFEFDSEDLFQKVRKTLVAQDKPLRRVITEIARKYQNPLKKKEALLITGSTGVGKTKMIELIAKNLNKPFYKVDAMQLTGPGYTGKDIEEILWDLYIHCNRNKESVENAIIFFDEIDKKGSKNKDDHSGQVILNMLLGFIEGATYDACENMKTSFQSVKINTKNMIVILGGAYSDVYKNMRNKDIGFGATPGKIEKPTIDDFVEKAMMTDEFMGRVTVIKLNDLGVDDLLRIMEESDESVLKVQEKLFNDLGVKITFTERYKMKIAQEAVKRKTGARGLNAIVDEATWEAYEKIYRQSSRGRYEEVIIDEETIENSENFQLKKKI